MDPDSDAQPDPLSSVQINPIARVRCTPRRPQSLSTSILLLAVWMVTASNAWKLKFVHETRHLWLTGIKKRDWVDDMELRSGCIIIVILLLLLLLARSCPSFLGDLLWTFSLFYLFVPFFLFNLFGLYERVSKVGKLILDEIVFKMHVKIVKERCIDHLISDVHEWW